MSHEPRYYFGQRLRVAMAVADIGCHELGAKVGISRQAINKMARGKMFPKSSTFVAICEQLRVSLDWMMDARELDFITRPAPKSREAA